VIDLSEIGIVDTMLGVPSKREGWTEDFSGLIRDRSSSDLRHPAGYMFKDLPAVDGEVDYVAFLIAEMDRWGIDKGLLPVASGDTWGRSAVAAHPNRIYGFTLLDPNRGLAAARDLQHAVGELGTVAAAVFPSGTSPQVALDAPLMYVLYAKCVELSVPILVNAGVPGPRFPMATQHIKCLDTVCYDFPDLKIITRHGGEPWQRLAVKLMLKWPNLYYSTSAFAPRHYPSEIIDYANTRGADKVMYAGYFPSGLSLERTITELAEVGFRDHVWPKFLRQNALDVFGLTA
jgi:predicted TIM-barrel fold metal-dependent hydrolase